MTKSHVQSILIKRKKGMTLESAIKELERVNGIFVKVDITPEWYRFRQIEPDSDKFNYRTKRINKDLMFIIGFRK